jgi:hypothetical protein
MSLSLFSKRKDLAVRSLVLKLVNNHNSKLAAALQGPRLDSRVNLTIVVVIVPIEDGQLQFELAFPATTKEFSNTGVGVVLDRRRQLDRAILGFRLEGEMHFVRVETKHLDPMGGGFYQIGFQMTEVVTPSDYPELKSLEI